MSNQPFKKLSFSFLPIPEEIMLSKALSFGAKILFGIIAKTNKERVKFSVDYLSKRMGCSNGETKKRIKELKENNLIIVKRTGRFSIYELNFGIISLVQEPPQHLMAPNGDIRCIHSGDIRCIHSGDIDNIKNIIKETSKDGNQVALIRNYFLKRCKEIHNFEPEMAFAKEGKLIKEKLKRFSVEQLKDLIDKFFNSEVGERLGWSLSVCLSASVINQWLAGKLEKRKKPFFQDNPMRKINERWQVLVDGEWKEFAGDEKEIIYK